MCGMIGSRPTTFICKRYARTVFHPFRRRSHAYSWSRHQAKTRFLPEVCQNGPFNLPLLTALYSSSSYCPRIATFAPSKVLWFPT